MEAVHDDRYLVFLRRVAGHPYRPEGRERFVTSCSSYEEARQIQREYRHRERECVIRFNGDTGGGD